MKRVGELEAVVMDRLWLWGQPTTVREVLEDLRSERKIAYTTVMTVMDNLHRKGFLARELDGRAYRYRPTQGREEYAAELMREVLDSTRNRAATLVHFLGSMSPDDVGRLRTALDAEESSDR